LTYANGLFDVVLSWNLPDYMEESLVKTDNRSSVVGDEARRPATRLLHTRDAGPDAPCYRFHMTGTDMLETQEVRLAGGGANKFRACSGFQ